MKSAELRQKYLYFFKSKGHSIIPSASLVPENDPTVLFTTAGMHPLVPYLLGQKHPEGTRLTDAQKCIRTGDIDDVGDDTHLTFFEMLGNWSLGDYWKDEAIKWSFEFLTKELKIPLDRFAVSCFAGDDDAPKDEESAKIWESLGVKKERIAFLPKEDNWWGPAGQTGPCGPDTEMFYWKLNDAPAPEAFDSKNKNWVEIWNDVFMQYVKDEKGNYNIAKQKNVDTGMGLERTVAVLNGKENVYETDLFLPIIEKIEELSGKKYADDKKSFRIIADHIKASTFLLAAEIEPSNLGRGYILRRLIRRAIRYGKQLGINESFILKIYPVIEDIYGDFYTEIKYKKDFILDQFKTEEEKFEKTLDQGLKDLDKELSLYNEAGNKLEYINSRMRFYPTLAYALVAQPELKNMNEALPVYLGIVSFHLYQSGGFPFELTMEEIKKHFNDVDFNKTKQIFDEEITAHQNLSRTASAGMFKGGLADASVETTKLHTAAHLMLAGLRKVLGTEVYQKGSNITAERLRFDFSHKEKMTSEQLKDVENFVNDIIKKNLPVVCQEMTLDEAKKINAMGVFESKYGQNVKVYTIGSGDEVVSREICGGPHVERTGVLGHFKIQKEESSSSGVRRIKAILE